MKKQVIISVSREFGSGGRQIARELSAIFGLPLYDRNLLEEIFGEDHVNLDEWEKLDEKPRPMLFSKKFAGNTNSSEHFLASKQFEFLKKKADAGESYVVVGRCSEEVLKDYDCLISIFVAGDFDVRVKRIKDDRKISEKEARSTVEKHDKQRKRYHNSYCTEDWGNIRGYDICVNSTPLGIEGTLRVLENYIKERMSKMKGEKKTAKKAEKKAVEKEEAVEKPEAKGEK